MYHCLAGFSNGYRTVSFPASADLVDGIRLLLGGLESPLVYGGGRLRPVQFGDREHHFLQP